MYMKFSAQKEFNLTSQTLIFRNASLSNGIFPDDFKIARVSPIHKSGNKEERGNYRPISILSIIAKLFGKLACSQLNIFLTKNNILSPCQSGFRKGHSTTTAPVFEKVTQPQRSLNHNPQNGFNTSISANYIQA